MRKILLSLPLLLFAVCCSAQTTGGTAPAKTNTASKAVKPTAPKDTSLCSKRWDLIAVEEWAVESKPKKKQQDDYVWMTGDGKYNLKRNGEAKSGTWTRSGAYINFTDDASKEKFTYKVESAEAKKLKVDYHVSDMHTLFTFEVK
jgi:hypothetical protein